MNYGLNINKDKIIYDYLNYTFPTENIVFTNGCFDILHLGHIQLLHYSKSLGDKLVVGLNSDESVRRLKGSGRPINNFENRSQILSYFNFIDYIVLFEENTPELLIKHIRPKHIVKGGDYKENEIVGADFVKNIGGSVHLFPIVINNSTTDIINIIREKDVYADNQN